MRTRSSLVVLFCIAGLLQGLCAQGSKPNIVFILADDMGLGDVRSYTSAKGQAKVDSPVDTPHIDRLATLGMRFTNAHSPSSVCTPTRYALLNGQYAWRVPLPSSRQKSGVLWPHDPAMISPQRHTVAEMLKAQGYTTSIFGKWHLGNNWVTTDGLPAQQNGSNVNYSLPFTGGATDNGFDYYFGDDVINHLPYSYIENNKTIATPSYSQVDSLPEVTRRSIKYLIKQKSVAAPFFMYMSLSAPHSPIVPPVQGIPADPSIGMTAYAYDPAHDKYENFIRLVDWTVGQIVNTLESQGMANNTMIVFTSDNGVSTNYTVNGAISPGFINGTPLRGRKADAWEGGHRMPFVVRWDGKVAPGSVSNELIELNDFYATTVDMLGTPMPSNAGEDSVSYLKVIMGVPSAKGRQTGVQSSQYGSKAIRQIDSAGNEWKLIFGVGGGGWLSGGSATDPNPKITASYNFNSIQMYNLATDPGERTNLLVSGGVSAVELAKAQELQTILLKIMIPGTNSPSKPVSSEILKFDLGVDTQQTSHSSWNNIFGSAGGAPRSIASGAVVSTTGLTAYGLDTSGFGSGKDHGTSGAGANWNGPYPIGGSGVEGGVLGSDMALKDGLFARSGDTPSLRLTSLPPGSVWNCVFYGARGNSGGPANFTATGVALGSASIANVFQNAVATATVRDVVVPANGSILFTLSSGGGTPAASLNALVLTRCDAWTANYGTGHSGTNGVPALTTSAPPQLGTVLNLMVGSSMASTTPAAFLAGFQHVQTQTPFGGTLLLQIASSTSLSVPSAGASVAIPIPNNLNLCGLSVFFQSVLLDTGASHGLSFSRGLQVALGR